MAERVHQFLRVRVHAAAPVRRAVLVVAALASARGLHSSTFQLNLSRVCHKKPPYTS